MKYNFESLFYLILWKLEHQFILQRLELLHKLSTDFPIDQFSSS